MTVCATLGSLEMDLHVQVSNHNFSIPLIIFSKNTM